MNWVNRRIQVLKDLINDGHYGKHVEKIKDYEFDQIVAFIKEQGEVDHNTYAPACRRLHLDKPKSPNWNLVQEICEVVGLRSRLDK